MKILKWALVSIILFIAFALVTFDYGRLTPTFRRILSTQVSIVLNQRVQCTLQSLQYAPPVGIKMKNLKCLDGAGIEIVSFDSVKLLTLFNSLQMTALMGKGALVMNLVSPYGGKPSNVELDLSQVPLAKLSPIIAAVASSAMRDFPKSIQLEGVIDGQARLPLKSLGRSDGAAQIEIKGFKIPEQTLLFNLFGLRDLPFTKSIVKFDLKQGRLNLQQVEFENQTIRAKAEGQFQLVEPLQSSTGNVALKWKIERNPSILSAPLGATMLNFCPSPDASGFCTCRITKASELKCAL